jgi:hypothetical protein
VADFAGEKFFSDVIIVHSKPDALLFLLVLAHKHPRVHGCCEHHILSWRKQAIGRTNRAFN